MCGLQLYSAFPLLETKLALLYTHITSTFQAYLTALAEVNTQDDCTASLELTALDYTCSEIDTQQVHVMK